MQRIFTQLLAICLSFQLFLADRNIQLVSYEQNNLNTYNKQTETCYDAYGVFVQPFYSKFSCISTHPTIATDPTIPVFGISNLPPHFKRDLRIELYSVRYQGLSASFKLDSLSPIAYSFNITGDERLKLPCQKNNTGAITEDGDFYYNFNINTTTIPFNSSYTIFSIIETTSGQNQSYIRIKAIQYNVENCDNTCLQCSGTSTSCTQCDTNCSTLQSSSCVLNKSNFVLQEGKCVAACSSPHFNINGKCVWIPNCAQVASGSIYCTSCQTGFKPVQTNNYEAQCQYLSCPNDYEIVNGICQDKKINLQGSYLLQALYGFTFSSFELDKNGLIYTRFVNVNNYSSKYTRCGTYQLFGGYFSYRNTSLIATTQFNTTYQYVRVSFKWVLIDYTNNTNPIGLTISVVGSTSGAQGIQITGITPSQICGLSANDYVGNFQYDFLVPNGKVTLNILNQMAATISTIAQDTNGDFNKYQYFGIRELFIYQFNCLQSNCIACSSISSGCTQCSQGYYLSNSACLPCLPDCISCTVGTQCTVCTGGRTLNANQCVCASKQYWNGSQCVACSNTSCNTCSPSDSTICLSCLSNTYLYNGQCQSYCPSQYFKNTTTLTCDQCVTNCQQCTNNTSCSQCLPNYYLQPSQNSCLATCPSGYQLNISNWSCKACTVSNCVSCQADISQCTQCAANYNLQGTQCQATCNSQYYASNQVCLLCSQNFTNCFLCNASSCTQCQSSYYLYQGTCTSLCPQSYYQDTTTSIAKCTACQNSNCSTCQPASQNCLSCISTYYLNGNSCVADCGANMYPNSSNVCTLCSSLFLGCQSCSSTQCTSCISATDYLDSVNNSCGPTCPVGYFQSTTSSIPSINICSTCNSNCLNCTSNSTNCISCKSNMYLQGNQCQSSCNQGYIPDSNGICVNCNTKFSNCSQCTVSSCSQCQNSYYLVSGNHNCVTSCPQGYATTTSPINQCILCTNTACNSCSTDLVTCITCTSIKPYLSNGTCVTQCNSDQYVDTVSSTCNNCGSKFIGCQTCTQNSCLSCSNSSQYLDITTNSCVAQCNPSLIPLTAPISQCVQNCTTIDQNLTNCILCNNSSGTTICQLCTNQKVLSQNSCEDNCLTGYYANSQNICTSCSSLFQGCYKCTSTSCQQCQNLSDYFDPIIGQCVNQCQNGANPVSPQNVCQQCINLSCQTCSASDLRQCLSCNTNSSNTYLQDGNCVQNCSSQYYVDQNSCLLCSSIHSQQCISCDSTQCYQCSANYYLSIDNQTCIQDCLQKQYKALVNGIQKCQNCQNSRCAQCDPTAPSKCLSCDQNQPTIYLENSQCNLSCSSTTYPDQNNICQLCSNLFLNCQQCTSISCTQCVSNHFLDSASNTCVQTCPPGQYGSILTNNCEQCGQSTECSVCNSSSPNICTQCNSSYYLLNSICVIQCPDNTYPDSNNQCLPCTNIQSSCLKCASGKCTQCIGGDIYLNPLTNLCDNNCPDGYYKYVSTTNGNKICQQCSNPLCKTCQIDGSCLSCYSALPQKYLNGSQCDTTCPQYIDGVNNICVNSCNSNETLNPNTFICTICTNLIYNNQCLTSCPTGTIIDPLNSSRCTLCSNIYSNCSQCNSSQCTQCVQGYYESNGICGLNCPGGLLKDSQTSKCVSNCSQPGYYADSNSQSCLQCDLNQCAQCVDNSSKCTKCNQGYYFYQQTNQCYQNCPAQTYLDPISQQCLSCTQPTCLLCDSATKCTQCSNYLNTDDSQCYTSCPNGKYIYQNQCVSSCPQGSFYQSQSKMCISCPQNCLNCTSLTNCTQCQQNYQNISDLNLPQICDQCISGFYMFSQQCEQCSTNCLTCKNSDSYCLSCPLNQYLNNNNQCIQCQQNQYFDSITLNCVNNQTGGVTPQLIISDQISVHNSLVIINAYITFDTLVIIKNQNWIFSLDQVQSSDYKINYSIFYVTNSSYQLQTANIPQEVKIMLQIQITESSAKITYQNLYVNFVDSQNIVDSKNFELKKINLIGKLPNYNPQTYPQVSSSIQVISALAGVNLLMLLLSSPFYLLVSFFDILQLANYLLYLNVQYGSSLYNVIRIFDFANFETIPNIKNEHSNAPYKFQHEKVDTFIYSNLIQSAAIWCFSYVLYLASKLINRRFFNQQNLLLDLSKIYENEYFYQTIVGLGFLTYCDLTLSVFLQFYDSENITAVTCIGIVSSIILLCAIIFLNVITFSSVKVNIQNLIKSNKLKQIYGFLYSGLELNHQKVFMNMMFLIRKTVVLYQLVYNSDSPVNQSYVCCLIVGVETTIMFIIKPYRNYLEQILHLLSRVFMIFTIIIIINLALSDEISNLGDYQSNLLQIIASQQGLQGEDIFRMLL
ncbi:hypothetical protein ABPG72_016090 [Tetrahymena utriculariae]